MLYLQKIKEKWMKESIITFQPVDIESILNFQIKNNIIVPNDLKEYFKILNGTGGEYTTELYEFYSIERIKKVLEEFQDWKGIPNYQPLVNLNDTKNLFVFANFSFNLFAYGIKLYEEKRDINEIYVFCGEKYKKISNNFSDFLELYLNDSIELQL